MDKELIKTQLYQWMEDFVEKKNPLLNDWAPCPYARQARIDGKIEIVFTEPRKLMEIVEKNLHVLDSKDVLIVCFNHSDIHHELLSATIKLYNSKLMKRDYVILEDHPTDTEMLNSVKMNFGECGLLLVQKLSKLTSASEQIREKGYYDIWSEDNLADVVTWRT
tara:strand:+ start:550 stop:1041 length:492 start_codon:yes stop_codon:yes gene_type:complete